MGFRAGSDEGLRLELLGDAVVLLFSVFMKGVLKLHHLFYDKPEKKPSRDSAPEDLETQQNPLEKRFLEKVRKQNERKKLREIYEKYLISSPLEEM